MNRNGKLSLALALLLPILALGAMVARAELITRGGRPWLIPIKGYDPRDLVRGHYLTYRFDWTPAEACTASACCLCFQGAAGPAPAEPDVSRVSCDAVSACQSWFPESRVASLQQFFIPEGRGVELQGDVRAKRAQILLRVSADGGVVITDLLLDGVPWRDVTRGTDKASESPR
jgi:uncharacterized membrane-anchored protein